MIGDVLDDEAAGVARRLGGSAWSVQASARRARESGFDTFWLPRVTGLDALVALGVVAREVPVIELATAVGRTGRLRSGRPVRGPTGRPRVALATRVAIEVPRTASAGGLLEQDEIVNALVEPALGHAESSRSGAYHRDVDAPIGCALTMTLGSSAPSARDDATTRLE